MAISAEQQARDMLERLGHPTAQSMTAGDLVELANLINECERLRRDQIAEAFHGLVIASVASKDKLQKFADAYNSARAAAGAPAGTD